MARKNLPADYAIDALALEADRRRKAGIHQYSYGKLVAEGTLPVEKFQASYGAWKNHISHGNCIRLGSAMDEKIEEILQGRDQK